MPLFLHCLPGLNASLSSLSATNKKQAEQNEKLQERIKELTAQVAWLNRQLFGRKSEKLRIYDPDMPDLFADEFSGLLQLAEEKRDEAVEKIKKGSAEVRKQNRQNRKMIEDLPVLETDTKSSEPQNDRGLTRIGDRYNRTERCGPVFIP